MGAISAQELVGNVERSVVQSSHITEPLFWAHNQCKRHTLNMLLNTAKGAWEQTGKRKLSYIFDNGERAYIDILDNYQNNEYTIYQSLCFPSVVYPILAGGCTWKPGDKDPFGN